MKDWQIEAAEYAVEDPPRSEEEWEITKTLAKSISDESDMEIFRTIFFATFGEPKF